MENALRISNTCSCVWKPKVKAIVRNIFMLCNYCHIYKLWKCTWLVLIGLHSWMLCCIGIACYHSAKFYIMMILENSDYAPSTLERRHIAIVFSVRASICLQCLLAWAISLKLYIAGLSNFMTMVTKESCCTWPCVIPDLTFDLGPVLFHICPLTIAQWPWTCNLYKLRKYTCGLLKFY